MLPCNDEVITIAHTLYRLNDLALVVFNDLDTLEILEGCHQH
jgi:hypothetical protein